MERRHFLKIAVGAAAGAAVLAASAEAALLSPQPLTPLAGDQRLPSAHADPAVVTGDEVDRLKPEEVRWGWHRHWHRRHWGWRHRHWGWHRRHWHRWHWRRWHHRHW
jgi:hypothetical protein